MSGRTKLQQFLNHEAAGGIVMLFASACALLMANSPAHDAYVSFISLPLGSFTLSTVVQDMLMPIFFLLVGMELKHEMLHGFLKTRSQKILPLIAAVGGIVTPAAIYMLIPGSDPLLVPGWAIPTATDIAFAVCALSLLGSRVPPAAKIFLLAIAIYDDLAAIIIIALFYSEGVAITPLIGAVGITLSLALLNHRKIPWGIVYIVLGITLWLCLHAAHVHTTVAGMIVGLFIPAQVGSDKPLERWIAALHKPVAFMILPLFAFASAGVSFTGIRLTDMLMPLPLGIAAGLFLGKPLGIFTATYASVKFGFAQKPEGANWLTILGIAVIAGIGFAMSLFIGFLAFNSAVLHDAIKLGVFTGSAASAVVGILLLRQAVKQ